jgi:tRNA nucleotidyltransferase (CCA-adding enzyme)
MVRKEPMSKPAKLNEDLAGALWSTYPELAAVRERADDVPVYLVGGAVRDLLLGRGRADLDLVVEGDAAALAAQLGADVLEHERFSTAKVSLDGHEVDIAAARTETYSHPGALPDVKSASLSDDLARRDFTINAIAIPLGPQPALVDPHGGRDDLAAGLLRVLHPNSFVDDPTRALRGARYAARFDFELEAATAELIAGVDLSTISEDRREAELLRIAAEAEPVAGFARAFEWGLIETSTESLELASEVTDLTDSPPWSGVAGRQQALLAAVFGRLGRGPELAAAHPRSPSDAVERARGHNPVDLVLGRVLGAQWLDSYVSEWRAVRLEIGGEDLIAAGIPEGPSLGRGLNAALRRKLDGEIAGREQELAAALEAAKGSDAVA